MHKNILLYIRGAWEWLENILWGYRGDDYEQQILVLPNMYI